MKIVWIMILFVIVISLLAISAYAYSIISGITNNTQECRERCNVNPEDIENAKTTLIIGIFISSVLILFMSYFIWMQFQSSRQREAEGANILAKLGIQKKPVALSQADIASMEDAIAAIESGSLVVGSKPSILTPAVASPAATSVATALGSRSFF